MIRTAVRAALAVLVFLVITGLVYPLAMTAVAQIAFGDKANGSIRVVDGRAVGSSRIGQAWEGPQWFYGRPSAIDYDASTSGGSNLGPNSQDLAERIKERASQIIEMEGPCQPGLNTSDIPVDLLTASASGLDPDISPEAAAFQAPRIGAERGLSIDVVTDLIEANTQGRTAGFLGEPRVNVLGLNIALQEA